MISVVLLTLGLACAVIFSAFVLRLAVERFGGKLRGKAYEWFEAFTFTYFLVVFFFAGMFFGISYLAVLQGLKEVAETSRFYLNAILFASLPSYSVSAFIFLKYASKQG